VQIETLVVKQKGGEVVAPKYNIKFNVEVDKLPIFDGDTNKIVDFIIACKLYIRMRIREISAEEQV